MKVVFVLVELERSNTQAVVVFISVNRIDNASPRLQLPSSALCCRLPARKKKYTRFNRLLIPTYNHCKMTVCICMHITKRVPSVPLE